MKCQWLVERHEPWTHAMSDVVARCKNNAAVSRYIPSGKCVFVCGQHAKKIDYRSTSDFFTTPDSFFFFEEE